MAIQPTAHRPRRVTLVADELLGHTKTGGIGTATTFLALALARAGNQVELLYSGPEPKRDLTPEWASVYDSLDVRIRPLNPTSTQVEPPYFARPLAVERALADDPPDVVIAQDLAAPACTALRMRAFGLAFERTLFVVYCHGGRRWITDTARKVRVLPGAHAITLLEQSSVELADVVVSPSAYLLDWMREEQWQLPERARVIPHVSRTAALGEATRAKRQVSWAGPIERIAFFGRLEDRKGLRPFAAGVNALEPELLEQIELEFIGRETPAWPRERIEALFSARTRDALRAISFATELDQPEALSRLRRPGTLAVMPSLGETFSNAVFECLENEIPFIASDAGAPKELIDPADHPHVLFEPTPTGVADALRRALGNGSMPAPVRTAFDPKDAVDQWAEIVQLEAQPRVDHDLAPKAEPVRRSSQQPIHSAAASSASEWVVVMDEDTVPDDELVPTLTRAQVASQADVVTCGVRLPSGKQRMFFGDPGGLGILANHYGTVGLMRRSLLRDTKTRWPAEQDVYWPLFARLTLEGTKIVSVPRALVEQQREPGDVHRAPADALLVADEFERHLPPALRSLARLTAGLAAATERAPKPTRHRLLRRLSR